MSEYGTTPLARAMVAERIYRTVQTAGPRQVRIWNGHVRTYPICPPRGYGTRGMLVGVYNLTVRLNWIIEDLECTLGEADAKAKEG